MDFHVLCNATQMVDFGMVLQFQIENTPKDKHKTNTTNNQHDVIIISNLYARIYFMYIH